jgi:hypothetical protein
MMQSVGCGDRCLATRLAVLQPSFARLHAGKPAAH